MKKLLIFSVFIVNLYAGTVTPEYVYLIHHESPKCYGSDSSLLNFGVKLQKINNEGSDSKWSPSYKLYEEVITHTVDGITYHCSPHKYAVETSNIVGDEEYLYFQSTVTGMKYSQNKYKILQFVSVNFPSECMESPDLTTINGYSYQGITDTQSSCQSLYNDNGDGNGFQFSNPNLDSSCSGFCYFNEPSDLPPCQESPTSNVIEGFTYQSKTADYSACEQLSIHVGDGLGYHFSNPNADSSCSGFCYYNMDDTTPPDDNNPPDDNPSTGEEVKLADVIPYIDELENKNEDIKHSLDNLNSNLNSQFTNLNSNQDNLNTTMSNLDGTLQNLNTSIQELKDSNNSGGDGSTPPDYSGVTDGFNIDPNIDEELNAFQSDIETSISSSFDTYSNVFGLGGYGSAPTPIKFNLLGKIYTVFDISYISSYIEQIRNVFIITGYLFGIFLVFRGD